MQEPNWVDKATFVVLAITMVAVIIYAREAHRQNGLLNQTVEQEVIINRPVLIGNGVKILEWKDKVPSRVGVIVINFGKTVAPAATVVGHIFLTEPGEPAPTDPQCNEFGPWPTGAKISALAPGPFVNGYPGLGAWSLSPAEGQDVAEANSGKTLFVVGCTYYKGLDNRSWFSDFCVSWAGGDNFPACQDHSRNYVH